MHGFYNVGAATLHTKVANPAHNTQQMQEVLHTAGEQNLSLVVFPELCITGYTCADLFLNESLQNQALEAMHSLLKATANLSTIFIAGVPLMYQNRLYNCACICQNGQIKGIVPKSYLANHKEFYEKRWFHSGKKVHSQHITLFGEKIPFGTDLLFSKGEFILGVEICEDLWATVPPSLHASAAGATLIANLSSSNELISKARFRKELVKHQSARVMGGYVYAGSGPGESSTDLVFGGDCLIAQGGKLFARSKRFLDQNQLISYELDLQRARMSRLHESSYEDGDINTYQFIKLDELPPVTKLEHKINPHPFVPKSNAQKSSRAGEITAIVAAGLQKRLHTIGAKKVVIGISGGLDSTLALLFCAHAFELMGLPASNIHAVTMPGLGTTGRTKTNAHKLCQQLGVSLQEIDISAMSREYFALLGHDEADHSVVYENVQARVRTEILMNTANKTGGIVIGTGDLSEIALGWSTYNGDHMSMYNLNASIPKTLIRYLVGHFAKEELEQVLLDILDTPVSPELLPNDDDVIAQETEELIGPYELHDFFLYHFMKYGAGPKKLHFLAVHAFENYDSAQIKKWLLVFVRRFFTAQFKRSAMPDGPKVGSISLSQRGDLKMPSDADFSMWIKQAESI
ncbi:MAG: NAD(+) synthase [Campylobacterota bacterium]